MNSTSSSPTLKIWPRTTMRKENTYARLPLKHLQTRERERIRVQLQRSNYRTARRVADGLEGARLVRGTRKARKGHLPRLRGLPNRIHHEGGKHQTHSSVWSP